MSKVILLLAWVGAMGCAELSDPFSSSSSCNEDEVEAPNGSCWARCRSDQRWLGDRCSDPTGRWVQAAAIDRCAETGGHLVTRNEIVGVLDRCMLDADGDSTCYSCAASGTCGNMYDGTNGDANVAHSIIWTSTPCTLPPPLTGRAAYLAYLDDGVVTCFWVDQNVGYPLCVRD